MHEQIIGLNLLSDVVISEQGSEANTVSSMGYIPGSTIRGALAGLYIRKNGLTPAEAHRDEGFYRLFLINQLRYENAYLTVYDQMDPVPLKPVPYYIQSNKEGDCYNVFAFDPDNEQDRRLKADLKPCRGYCYVNRAHNLYRSLAPNMQRNFHMSRNRADSRESDDLRLNGTSDDGTIFNYEAIKKGQCFTGSIRGEDGLIEELIQKTMGSNNTVQLRIGRSRNIQYGQVELKLVDPAKFYEDVITLDVIKTGMVLILASPAILLNDYGFAEVSADMFAGYLKKLLGINVTVDESFIRAEKTEGYVNVWKSRRPSSLAFAAGSCFKLSFPDECDLDSIGEPFIKMLERGIGERLNEGYGRITVASDMAKEMKVNKDTDLTTDNGIDGCQMPPGVAALFERIIDKQVKHAIEEQARSDALNYWNTSERYITEKDTRINAHVMGRLEAILDHSHTANEKNWHEFPRVFGDGENALQKSFREKLDFPPGENNLLHQLINSMTTVENYYRSEMDKYNIFQRKINASLNEQQDDQEKRLNEMYTLYWKAFFRQIRFKLKGEKR